jgi:2-succinyl-6-hydroxy-2,4-cyclohexadiene-1-carboxylate synthase
MEGGFSEVGVRVCGHKAVVKRYSTPSELPVWSILALHGFTGSGADFNPLRKALSDLSIDWLCPDFMGHGDSESPRNVDPYRLTAALSLIDRARQLARNPDKVVLLAYSMGGRIALHYLRWAKPLPTVLIGASPGLEDPGERVRRRSEDARLIDPACEDVTDFCAKWEAQPLIQPQTHLAEPLRSELAGRRRKNSLIGLANSLAACGTAALPSLWSELPGFSNLTCLYGERDSKFAAVARRMQSANPAIRIAGIPDSGHAAHLENPEAVAEELKFQLQIVNSR